jgi:flagellar L-ring protein precursor FlgH
MRYLSTLIACALISLSAAPAARAESIWANRDASAAYLYRDNVAQDIGDSLTLVITESSSFQFSGSRDMDKTSTHKAIGSFKRGGSEDEENESLIDPYELSEQSSRDFAGSSAYTGRRTFRDSITVTVMDRLPNGNMVVSGRSFRKVDGEDTLTIVTGIVRPVDVSGANRVTSQRVAQLQVHYETNGPSRAFLTQGWLGRIINVIWPF